MAEKISDFKCEKQNIHTTCMDLKKDILGIVNSRFTQNLKYFSIIDFLISLWNILYFILHLRKQIILKIILVFIYCFYLFINNYLKNVYL